MTKSFEETAAERREYVDHVRASFYEPTTGQGGGSPYRYGTGQERELPSGAFGFGAKLIVAILIFAAFVYCDQKNITFQTYGTEEVARQIEWNPLPVGQLIETATTQP